MPESLLNTSKEEGAFTNQCPAKRLTLIILPPLLNRYKQDNNVHIWARGPAKPPCPLFNIYADMYKYQVISINE